MITKANSTLAVAIIAAFGVASIAPVWAGSGCGKGHNKVRTYSSALHVADQSAKKKRYAVKRGKKQRTSNR